MEQKTTQKKIRVITDIEEARKYISNANLIAFKLYTAPLDAYKLNPYKPEEDPYLAQIVGISLSVDEDSAVYIPAKSASQNMDSKDFNEFLVDFLTDRNLDINKVTYDLAFASKFAYALGIVLFPTTYDIQAAGQLTLKEPNVYRKLEDCSLTSLSEAFLKETPSIASKEAGEYLDEVDFEDEANAIMVAMEANYILRIYHAINEWFDNNIPDHKLFAEAVENACQIYLGIQRYVGVPIDVNRLLDNSVRIKKQLAELKVQLNQATNTDVGDSCSNSAFTRYVIANNSSDINVTSTDDSTLQALLHAHEESNPDFANVIKNAILYRKLSKGKATFLDGLKKNLHPITCRVHPVFLGQSTETARVSCYGPNIQALPRPSENPDENLIDARNLIKAPPGHVIISVDLSQIELRIASYFSRDQTLLEAFDKGTDIHALTTAAIYGIPLEEAKDKSNPTLYKTRRSVSKLVNFGVMYSIYPKGLQKKLEDAGIHKTIPECTSIIESIKRAYHGIVTWQEETKKLAYERGYVESKLGRRRYLPNIRSADWQLRSQAERFALNTVIQSTGAELLKSMEIKILFNLPDHPWLKPFSQVHDQLDFICEESHVDEAVEFIKDCMENVRYGPWEDFDVKLVAEAQVGPTLSKLKDL